MVYATDTENADGWLPDTVLRGVFTACLAVAMFAGCKKIKNTEPDIVAVTDTIARVPSFVSIPLAYSMDEFQEMVNSQIPQTLHTDDSFENNNNDNIKYVIRRNGEVVMTAKGNQITYSVPLHVDLEAQVAPKILGRKRKLLSQKLDFALTAHLKSEVGLDEEWKLATKTDYQGVKWVKKPVVTALKIDLSNKVEEILSQKAGELLAKLDRLAHDKVNLRKPIEKVWGDLQKPILVNRQKRLVWLVAEPFGVVAGPIHAANGYLNVEVGIRAYAYSHIGDTAGLVKPNPLPPLTLISGRTGGYELNVLAKIPFKEANALLAEELAGMEFDIQGRKIKIKEARIMGSGQDILLKVVVRGRVKGDVYFRGRPRYDEETHTLSVTDFDFDVYTEETLLHAANWLLHDDFRDKIAEKLVLPLAGPVSMLPALINQGIEKGKTGEKITLTIHEMAVYPASILVTNTNLEVMLKGTGSAVIELHNLVKPKNQGL